MLLGRIEQASRDVEAARHAYEAAATTVADVREARVALASLITELGEYEEAERHWRSLISENPSDSEARRQLALALGEAGRLDEAVQELEQLVLRSQGDPESSYLLATAYLEASKIEAAEQILSALQRSLPTAATYVLVGRTYRDADLFGEAREAFNEALALDPTARRAHYYLGTLHLLEEGTAALDRAASEFEAELATYPDDVMSHLYLGMARVEQRAFQASLPHLELAVQSDTVKPQALRYLGRSLFETGRYVQSVAASTEALVAMALSIPGEGPDDAAETLSEPEARMASSIHYQLGQALRALEQPAKAKAHFDAAKRYQARSTQGARESLARYLEDGEAARSERNGGSALSPQGREELIALRTATVLQLARTYLDLGILLVRGGGDHLGGAELMNQAAALAPELPGLANALGVALFNAQRFEDAVTWLSRARQAGEGDAKNLPRMLALAWLNSGHPEEAARILEQLPERAREPGLEYAFGLALNRSGQSSRAAAVFSELLRGHADWPELNVVLGQALAAEGDFDGALQSLTRALELDPRVAEAEATRAEIHLRRGELEEAERALRAELAAHPSDIRAAFTLATVLELRQSPQQAIVVLEDLLAREPAMAKARSLLGKLRFGEGDLEGAREQLEAAVGLDPGDPEAHYRLGQVYQRQGRVDDARETFAVYRRLKEETR